MRGKIAFRLAAIWLAVALPLAVILGASFWQRYQTRLSLIERERVGYARLSALAFRTLIEDSQRTMIVLGPQLATPGIRSEQAQRLLSRTVSLYPASHIVLVDTDGTVIAASRDGLLGQDFSGMEAFQMASKAVRGNAIEPSNTKVDGRAGLYIAQRVTTEDGTGIGIMMMRLDLQQLHDEYPMDPPLGGISIIDSKGHVVYQNEHVEYALSQADWGARYPFVRAALSGRIAPTRNFDFPTKERRVGAFVPVEPFGWAAGSSISMDRGLASFWTSLRLNLTLAALFSILGLGISAVFARSIRGGLVRLARDAEAIGAGDFDHPVIVDRSDEIGIVAMALERARQGLQLYQAENARLFQMQQEISNLNAALASIETAMHSSLTFTDVLSVVLERSTAVLGCDSAGVNLLEGDEWVRAALYGLPQKFVGERLTDKQNTVAAIARDTKEPVVIQDAATDERVTREFVERYGITSALTVPLMSHGEVFGVMFFNHLSDSHLFDDMHVDFVTKLASSLSLAYENARTFEAERVVAEKFQSALLALPEHVAGVEFAVCYRAASEIARVGGDFYDLFELGDSRVGVTIGDISGHGIDAAVLTSLVKTAVRIGGLEANASAAHVLERANHILYSGSAPESFATVMFGVLDTSNGRFVYANGGHTKAAVVSANEVRILNPTSPIVGAFADVKFANAETVVAEGDTLFLYTDGLIEARVEGGLYGEERLIDLLGRLHDLPPAIMAERVFDDVVEAAGDRLHDDIAILALRRVGES